MKVSRKYVYISLTAFFLIFFWRFCWSFSSSEWLGYLTGFGGNDHERLTQSAINSFGSAYPDIQMFANTIKAGAGDEGILGLGAHDDTSGSTTYWYGNEILWKPDLFDKYNQFQFSDAYERLGFQFI